MWLSTFWNESFSFLEQLLFANSLTIPLRLEVWKFVSSFKFTELVLFRLFSYVEKSSLFLGKSFLFLAKKSCGNALLIGIWGECLLNVVLCYYSTRFLSYAFCCIEKAFFSFTGSTLGAMFSFCISKICFLILLILAEYCVFHSELFAFCDLLF